MDSRLDLPRRYPWMTASLAAHALLLALAACLVPGGPVQVAIRQDDRVRIQVAASLEQTAQRQMRREVREMEAIRDALRHSAGKDGRGAGDKENAGDHAGSGDPAARARALAGQIEALRQAARAAEMARVLRIPEAAARKRLLADAAQARPAPAASAPRNVQVGQLLQQAKAALAERRGQLLAQRQGVSVAPQAGGGQGVPGGRGRVQNSASLGSTLDALATGLALGVPGAITGSSIDMASSAFSDMRGFGGYLAPPPVAAAGLRPGHGRTLGAGGPYANRVDVDTWYVIGPFEGAGHDSQNAVYPPERGIDLDAVYYGKNHLPVRWTFQHDAHYPSVPRPRAENAVYYAYTEVAVDRDMDLWVWIGGDDDTKMWFNDRLVWLSADTVDKPWFRRPFYSLAGMATLNLTEGQRRLHFHKGRNSLLLKLYNGVNLMFYSVVLSR